MPVIASISFEKLSHFLNLNLLSPSAEIQPERKLKIDTDWLLREQQSIFKGFMAMET